MTEELNTLVSMKHTSEGGAVLWEREHRATSADAADIRMKTDEERALISWPEGLVLFYLRPGERVEVYSKDIDAE